MKAILLTRGRITTVDDADYDYLSQFKWMAAKGYATYYAVRRTGRKIVRMHRVLLGETNPKVLVDHRSGDGTDNRRENLRRATSQNNNANRTNHKATSSKFKGVRWHKRTQKWEARIRHNKTLHYLGLHQLETAAAAAYNMAAVVRFGPFAKLNVIT